LLVETTLNNHRKNGRPNPDQKFFYLVVKLLAETPEGTVVLQSYASDKVIVRVSRLSVLHKLLSSPLRLPTQANLNLQRMKSLGSDPTAMFSTAMALSRLEPIKQSTTPS
jgi:hypothetical protein